MKQQNGKWYERYSVTPHPLGTMWTLWGISGIVSEPLGDYPTLAEAEEVKGKLEMRDEQEVIFPRLKAYVNDSGWNVYLEERACLVACLTSGTGEGQSAVKSSDYAKLFAASPKLLAFAEAYLEAVEDAEGDGDEVEALARMEDQARAAVDEARGRV